MFPQIQCRKCGLNWPHVESPCPAAGKNCRNCGKANHFTRMCRRNNLSASQHTSINHEFFKSQQNQSHHHKMIIMIMKNSCSLWASVSIIRKYLKLQHHGSLLSYTTAHALDVMDVKINAITAGDQLSQKYPTLFDGIGKLKDFEVKLHINQ